MSDPQQLGPSSDDSAVSGWLLVLCLVLCFIYPGTTLYTIASYAAPTLIGAVKIARVVLLSGYCVLFGALGTFSVLAGLKLWLVKRGAVQFARRFLITNMVCHFAYFLFWIAMIRPTQAVSFAEMGWYHVVGPIASTALWYFYLEHSKRVKETYRLA